MRVAFEHLPSPLMGCQGRYAMHIARKHRPSPLTGEGAGGGEDSPSSPHPPFPRYGGMVY
jgi:hypothetical protein